MVIHYRIPKSIRGLAKYDKAVNRFYFVTLTIPVLKMCISLLRGFKTSWRNNVQDSGIKQSQIYFSCDTFPTYCINKFMYANCKVQVPVHQNCNIEKQQAQMRWLLGSAQEGSAGLLGFEYSGNAPNQMLLN